MTAPVKRKLRDSSKTRVEPVFSSASQQPHWVLRSCATAIAGQFKGLDILKRDPDRSDCAWGADEKSLRPPRSILEWLVRNLQVAAGHRWRDSTTDRARRNLLERDSATIQKALAGLAGPHLPRAWYILEGPSYPDAFIETPDYVLVIEGKRTEGNATTDTTWLNGRYQMWRHMDAAWDIYTPRPVLGLMVVEGDADGEVPAKWERETEKLQRPEAVMSSLPHRSTQDRENICGGFVGVTTWQRLCLEFSLDPRDLPDTVSDLPDWYRRHGLELPHAAVP